MANENPFRIKTIREFHQLRGLPKPEHPLISVIDIESITQFSEQRWVLDFYSISLKRANVKFKYGQQDYDFDDGVLFFMAPTQVFGMEIGEEAIKNLSGWILLLHPDFLWNTPLAKIIKKYEYFDYSVNEALFLSNKEEVIINTIIQNIQQEYHGNMDKFSQSIILSHIETLLNYSERFYERQFITRKIVNHQILNRLEELLTGYFNSEDLIHKGLPTVQSISESLHVSISYLSRVLKLLTGQSTQQHIHDRLIEKAKEKLSTTDLSISEIAYGLGFEHSQSFSKLFKTKTALSPLEFRKSFN